MKKNFAIIICVLLVLVLAIGYLKFNHGRLRQNPDTASLANPASVFCVQNGGTLVGQNSQAGQTNNCTFPTGEICEEWTLFRGECNVQGVSNKGVYTSGTTTVSVIYRIKTNTAILQAAEFGYDNLDLYVAESGSGARYLSADGKVEFWEHQGVGTLSVSDKQIFSGNIVR